MKQNKIAPNNPATEIPIMIVGTLTAGAVPALLRVELVAIYENGDSDGSVDGCADG